MENRLTRVRDTAIAILSSFVAVSTAAGLAQAGDLPALAARPEVAARLDVLDAWIAETVRTREQPGLSIGIVYDQELIWAKGYGFADVDTRRPATPATLYRIASITKPFTATALMQLRDRGQLRLDDPVQKHLPWFRIKDTYSDDPPITIWHLMTHTSGLPRGSSGLPEGQRGFASRDQMIGALPAQETIFPTETEFKYSNLAWALAGEIVAQVSGEPYDRYIARHILEPLGMRSTMVHPQPATPGLATPYSRRTPGKRRSVQPFSDWSGLTPAANLASTVEDLAKFAALQMAEAPGSGQVLKWTTLREMHRVQWLEADWRRGQGLGFAIRRVGDQVQFGHGGSTAGFRTQLQISPGDKLAVIVLTNADDGDPGEYVQQAFKIVGPAIRRATENPGHAPMPTPEWQRYLGTYARSDSDTETQFVLLNGELTMLNLEDVEDPWEARVRLIPVRSHVFRMKGGSSSGELVTFQVDGQGQVTAVKVATSSIPLQKRPTP